MATLYAQSTGNWDAILWNTAANGSGTNETPGAADTLISNAFTVTVNGNYTVTKVTNTGGGTFTLANGVTLTCTDATAGVVGDAASVGAVTFGLTGTGESATLTAKVAGGNGTSEYGVNITGTKTLTINGSIIAGSANSAYGCNITAACIVNINGNITGGSNSYCYGLWTNSASVINVVGNVFGGGAGGNIASGILITNSAVVSITGNCESGAGTHRHLSRRGNTRCRLHRRRRLGYPRLRSRYRQFHRRPAGPGRHRAQYRRADCGAGSLRMNQLLALFAAAVAL